MPLLSCVCTNSKKRKVKRSIQDTQNYKTDEKKLNSSESPTERKAVHYQPSVDESDDDQRYEAIIPTSPSNLSKHSPKMANNINSNYSIDKNLHNRKSSKCTPEHTVSMPKNRSTGSDNSSVESVNPPVEHPDGIVDKLLSLVKKKDTSMNSLKNSCSKYSHDSGEVSDCSKNDLKQASLDYETEHSNEKDRRPRFFSQPRSVDENSNTCVDGLRKAHQLSVHSESSCHNSSNSLEVNKENGINSSVSHEKLSKHEQLIHAMRLKYNTGENEDLIKKRSNVSLDKCRLSPTTFEGHGRERAVRSVGNLNQMRQALAERGEKMNFLDQRAEAMKHATGDLSSSTHALADKYKSKKWYA